MTRPTRTVARTCAGKQRHPNRLAALGHIYALEAKGAARYSYEAYRCPVSCGGWHVGHRPGRGRR